MECCEDVRKLYCVSDVYQKVLDIHIVPILHFKPEWGVKIMPPFGGAVVRFVVEYNGRSVSVYADYFGMLGRYGADGKEPYWEMYPRTYKEYSDVMRFDIGDTENLIKNIDEELNGIPSDE